MTKLRITVTKEILEKTKHCSVFSQYSTTNCAIACAVRDVFPTAKVWANHIAPFTDHGKYKSIRLPQEAQDFIEAFDDATAEERVMMKPISFEIEVPDEVIEKINIDELKPLLENHPTLAILS